METNAEIIFSKGYTGGSIIIMIKQDKSKAEQKNLHAGHRERMEKRFLATEKDNNSSFQNHELLEMLLSFSIPRRNTNETAHLLLSKFGSLRGVFETSYTSLQEVPGVGRRSALLIRLVSRIIHCYIEESEYDDRAIHLDRMHLILLYLHNLFFGYRMERMYMLLFDRSGALMETLMLAEGTGTFLRLDETQCVRQALSRGTSYVILAHNHPGGTADVSKEDIDTTLTLERAFRTVGITLLDHYIITEKEHTPILKSSNPPYTA